MDIQVDNGDGTFSTISVPDSTSAAPVDTSSSLPMGQTSSYSGDPYGLSQPTSSSGNTAPAYMAPDAGSSGALTNLAYGSGAGSPTVDPYAQMSANVPNGGNTVPMSIDQNLGTGANGLPMAASQMPPGVKPLYIDPKTGIVLGSDYQKYDSNPSSAAPQAPSIYDSVKNLFSGNLKGAMSDPKGMMGALALMGAALAAGHRYQQPTVGQLQGQMPISPYNAFNPTQQAMMTNFANNFNPRVTNIRPATYKNYAEGGHVDGEQTFASGGALGQLVRGSGSGQQDNVKANLSPGEYVVDADVVSALGDGSNEDGAKRLDEMRAAIRAHKRSAPDNKIPAPAKHPVAYLNGKGK